MHTAEPTIQSTMFDDDAARAMAVRLIKSINETGKSTVPRTERCMEVLAMRVFRFGSRPRGDVRLLSQVYYELRRFGVVGFSGGIFWEKSEELDRHPALSRIQDELQPA